MDRLPREHIDNLVRQHTLGFLSQSRCKPMSNGIAVRPDGDLPGVAAP